MARRERVEESMDFFATGCEVGKGVELGDCGGTFLVAYAQGGVNVIWLYLSCRSKRGAFW